MTSIAIVRNRGPVVASATVGSLSFPGGASTANSGSVRILRTGAMDLNAGTIELFITASATAGHNAQEIAPGANYNLTNSNIILDGDNSGTRGFIIGLSAGVLVFGINTSGGARTIAGSTDLRDGLPHHVYVYRNGALLELGVDGVREASFSTGPTGLITYDGDAPATDAYHYFCKEKLNATWGCRCLLSEIRFSSGFQRYSGTTYTVPTARLEPDANTTGLYHMNEQDGLTMGDSSGNGFHGGLVGNPVPSWSSARPF